jgi:hypothetical protein
MQGVVGKNGAEKQQGEWLPTRLAVSLSYNTLPEEVASSVVCPSRVVMSLERAYQPPVWRGVKNPEVEGERRAKRQPRITAM